MKNENESEIFQGFKPNAKMKSDRTSRATIQDQIPNFKLPENNPLLPFGSCFVHHSGKQFTCIYDHCLNGNNCFRNELASEDSDYQELLFHPEDRQLWCDHAFPDIVRFANSLSLFDFQDYRFSFNHRYIRPDGNISQFLHEGTLSIKNNKDIPVLRLKVFTEIGDIKTDDSIVLSIFRHSADWGYQKVFNKVYSNIPNSVLTAREIEIIRLCHQGFSSKMIADKLTLSIHTVKNHKRKSMERTMTHNITELIHVCIQHHWL